MRLDGNYKQLCDSPRQDADHPTSTDERNKMAYRSRGVRPWHEAETAVNPVFQTEMHVIWTCANESIKLRYCKSSFYTVFDSQASIKTHENCRISCRLVWDCH
jgi:hypothetical protein